MICSACSECEIERIEQGTIAERLEQALNGTLFDHSLPHGRVTLSGDVDDRDFFLAAAQFLLEFRPGHLRHGDIENQTSSMFNMTGREELNRRRECTSGEAKFP